MSAFRLEIGRALDVIASDEGGMPFQELAVVLAKKRWADLVACTRKKDLGLDAYASAAASTLGKGMGLCCSISGTLQKLQKDAKRAAGHFEDLSVLVYATSNDVTNLTAEPWKKEIKDTYGWELIMMPREDIITTLELPEYAGICKQHLGIAVAELEPTVEALLEKALDATAEVTANWSRRFEGMPVIDLRHLLLDDKGNETHEVQRRSGLSKSLAMSQRIEIEAPAGRGKTTTLVQIAREHRSGGHVACLIDLPAWLRRNVEILEFMAGMPEFRSRGLTADALAQVNQASPITFLLNGWNELAGSESTNAAEMIRTLERSYAASGIAVATRPHPVAIPLPGGSRYRIQSLSRTERDDYLRGRLKDKAAQFSEQFGADKVLDALTRTPLILAEIVSLYEAGKPIPNTKLGVLDSVSRLMEQSENHQAALEAVPLTGFSRDYLQAIATSLVTNGGVQMPEAKARRTVSTTARSLQDSGQLTVPPDPGTVLTALCSHHVLERSAYPDVSYSFIHQQFQELFAALGLKSELSMIASNEISSENFIANYINEPAWTEPLEMLAEFIGKSVADGSLANAVAMGTSLVLMALPVDAAFAGRLARLCGMEVWQGVRHQVSERLRQLYGSKYEVSREVGLAGMVATGSDDFKDVLLPLLSDSNASSRMVAFRTGEPFHLSSLGADWEAVVRQWNEDARISFVVEMTHHGQPDVSVVGFALNDESPAVRKAYLSHVWWNLSSEEVARLGETLNDEQFEELITGLPSDYIPSPLRSRAASLYAGLGEKASNAESRFRAWRKATTLGATGTTEHLMQSLSEMDAAQLRGIDARRLHSTLLMLKSADSAWVSGWIVERILNGNLSPDEWMSLVDGISESLREEMLARARTENLTDKRIPGVIPLLRRFADTVIIRSLFSRLCELLPIVATSTSGSIKKEEGDLARQIEGMLREMPPQIVVESLLAEKHAEAEGEVMNAISEIFHIAGRNEIGLREALPTDLRVQFLRFLKSGIDSVLAQDDPHGRIKAYFATVLAQVGDTSDLPDVERLLQADLVRYRAERDARMAASVRPRRRRNP